MSGFESCFTGLEGAGWGMNERVISSGVWGSIPVVPGQGEGEVEGYKRIRPLFLAVSSRSELQPSGSSVEPCTAAADPGQGGTAGAQGG